MGRLFFFWWRFGAKGEVAAFLFFIVLVFACYFSSQLSSSCWDNVVQSLTPSRTLPWLDHFLFAFELGIVTAYLPEVSLNTGDSTPVPTSVLLNAG